jgi:hypothetical protein
MQRASRNGLHKRFYEKHRERINKQKGDYGKAKRRQEPTFGLWTAINEAKRSGDIENLARKCFDAITKLNETSRKRGSKSKDRSSSLPMRKRNTQDT